MGIKVLILGESGTGKSASMRNFTKDELYLVNVANKALPFKQKGGKFESISTDSYRDIRRAINATDKKVVVIDDSQYLMANEFMRRATEKGFDKFTEIGQSYWELNQVIDKLPEDVITYVLGHIERDQNGNEKIKTIGKLLDEKITVEGMYTIVLKTVVQDGKYYFQTQNSGHDTCKSPIGLFDSFLIDNDLKAVDKAIRDYYDIEQPDFLDELDRIDKKLAAEKDVTTISESEAIEPAEKTLAEKLADFQNKEPKAEEPTEEPKRRTRKPVVEEEPAEPTPVRRRRTVVEEKPVEEESTPVRRRRAVEEVETADTTPVRRVRRRA